jgi:uncharacterized protein
MNPNVQHLIELQRLDNEIRALEAEVTSLPVKVAEIESTLTIHIQQVESDKHALAENQKSRRKREGEIAAARDKISHYKDQSLQVKTNDQYKALLHEVEHQEAEIRRIEDQILGEMIESESLDRKLREAEAKLAEERKQAQVFIAAAEQRKSEDEEKLKAARAERAAAKAPIPIEIYEMYERIARGRKGEAVVEVIGGTCSACSLHLRPQVVSELISSDNLHSCENCGRILYYLPKTDVPAQPPEARRVEISGGAESTE